MNSQEKADNLVHLYGSTVQDALSASTEALKSGGGGGTFDGMEARVKRLEDDMKEVKGDLKSLLVTSAEIKTLLQSVSSKSDVESAKAGLSDRISSIEGQAKHMLTFWQFLIVVGGLLAIILRWPELFKLIGVSTGTK